MTHSTHPRAIATPALTAALATLALTPTPANAQLSFGTLIDGHTNPSGLTIVSPVTSSITTVPTLPELVLLNLNGDWTYDASAGGNTEIESFASIPLMIGDFPVEITDFQVTADAKLVTAGSTDPEAPTVTHAAGARIREQSTPATMTGGSFGNTFSGDIVHIFNNSSHTFTDTLLASNTTYSLRLFGGATIESAESLPTPTSVTNEFGGVTDFGGYSVNFGWRTVPTPATTLALLPLAAPLTRRRRH